MKLHSMVAYCVGRHVISHFSLPLGDFTSEPWTWVSDMPLDDQVKVEAWLGKSMLQKSEECVLLQVGVHQIDS